MYTYCSAIVKGNTFLNYIIVWALLAIIIVIAGRVLRVASCKHLRKNYWSKFNPNLITSFARAKKWSFVWDSNHFMCFVFSTHLAAQNLMTFLFLSNNNGKSLISFKVVKIKEINDFWLLEICTSVSITTSAQIY